ncbi:MULTISPECIES: DUF6874 family protein [Clostridium]|uniref:DUF6874 domain-containing protein n=1 Tax=Clostridium faecium TaxID=2762223 RepID=A0ABR8YRB4_9CLOT|nr:MULTISPECIES: hypothetical protein [Clostridium]MBD8046776.1 hypothetical protein [Clostridium faecium]
MSKNENLKVIAKIVERAENKGLLMFDRLSLMMDLEFTVKEFDLRLEDLLNADDFNFSHDICGIQNNINRAEKKMENFFIPRFAR